MRKFILAAALISASGSAQAVVYTGEMQGVVTSQFATYFTSAGAKAEIGVGDAITTKFSFARTDGATGGPVAAMLGQSLAAMMTNEASFELGGHRWTSRGDFLAGLVTPQFGTAEDPFAPLSLTMDDAPAGGDLAVRGYDFEIGEFGYDLYQGYGYAGVFDKSSLRVWADGVLIVGEDTPPVAVAAVPEPATWAMMIAGFGLVGAVARRRTKVSFA